MAFGDRFKDFFGIGKDDGFGIKDDTGAYSGGVFGIGATPTSGPGSVAQPDFEQAQEDADAKAAAAMEELYGTVDELKGMAEDIPTFTEWMEQQGNQLNDVIGSDEYGGLTDLIARLEAGPTDEDYDAGLAHAARLMGLDPAEAETLIGDLSRQMTEGVEGASGMSPEEEALRRRQNQSNIRMAEQRAQRMVQDSLADTGSTARMLQTADEATMQINNMQIQQDASLAQEQFERQIAQFESQKQTWQTDGTD